MSEVADQDSIGVLRVGEAWIGVPIGHLAEVIPLGDDEPLPQRTSLIKSAATLRGRLIPMIDPQSIADVNRSDQSGRLGVILDYERKLVAIEVDQIGGIKPIKSDNLSELVANQSEPRPLFPRVYSDGDMHVSLLDIEALFSQPGLMAVRKEDMSRQSGIDSRPSLMTFSAGGAVYAVPAIEVHAAVPKQQINATAIAKSPCLGEISYHGRRVPVVCPVQILGIGTRRKKTSSEVVVLRFPGDLLLGLAVDSIQDIQSYRRSDRQDLPVRQGQNSAIEAVLVGESGEQVFSIDLNYLRSMDVAKKYAALSKPEEQSSVDSEARTDGRANVIREKEHYLVVELDEFVAIPLSHVNRILPPPTEIVPVDDVGSGILGYFPRLGKTIALIDLCRSSAAHDSRRLLLSEVDGKQFGFLVNSVSSIEVSMWREGARAKDAPQWSSIVRLGSKKSGRVLPLFDLLGQISRRELPTDFAEGSEPNVTVSGQEEPGK